MTETQTMTKTKNEEETKEEEPTQKVALYARVSTENQDMDNQIHKLKKWAEMNEVEYDLYAEKVSSIKDRPKFEQIMNKAHNYDKIVVTKIDRFARSIRDFNNRMTRLKTLGVELETTDQPIKTDDEMYGDFFQKLLALFAELERKMIRKRLKEGFEKAQREGRVGRPKADIDMQQLKEMREMGASYSYLARHFDVCENTIYRKLKELGMIDTGE